MNFITKSMIFMVVLSGGFVSGCGEKDKDKEEKIVYVPQKVTTEGTDQQKEQAEPQDKKKGCEQTGTCPVDENQNQDTDKPDQNCEQNGTCPANPVPNPTPTPAPGQDNRPEGDFSGILSIDREGGCTIESGDDNGGVSCSFSISNFTGEPQLIIEYKELGLTRLPVCTFQTYNVVGGNPQISVITNEKVCIELRQPSGVFTPNNPCHDPCWPSFDHCGGCPDERPAIGKILSFYCKVSG